MRKIAITDIHGCRKSFQRLLQKVELGPSDELILLGDYIDRGPDSKGVLDDIIGLMEQGQQVTCIKGNHEELMLTASMDWMTEYRWTNAGGKATLASFGVHKVKEIDTFYMDFVKSMPHFVEKDDYIFVHAGLLFGIENPLDAVVDMLWIRNWWDDIDYGWLKDRRIFHGHTPMLKKQIEKAHQELPQKQVMDLDGGCVYASKHPEYGLLVAYDLENDELFFQENVDC